MAEVLRLLGEIGSLNVHRLSSILTISIAVSYPTVLRMMRELERSGLVRCTKRGRTTIYKLTEPSRGWEDVGEDKGAASATPAAADYRRVAETSNWMGEEGADLRIGTKRCRPALPDAQLTLEAIYDAHGQQAYHLTATSGNVVLSEAADSARELAELIIPAADGAAIGRAAIEVGRLFPPTAPEHRFATTQRGRAARLSRINPARLGSLLALYQQHYSLSNMQLAEKLLTSPAALDNLMLCMRPLRCEEVGVAWNRYLRFVADIDGVPMYLLSEVLSEGIELEKKEML